MNLLFLTTDAAEGASAGSMLTPIIMMVAMIAVMYFIMIRPQNKKRKQEDEMRKSLEVGDTITTIGGIMGRVVSLKDETDSIIIETGADRSKVHIKRWAIASCDTVKDEA